MKRLIRSSYDEIFGMANVVPKKSGIPVDIWSDHSGITRKVSHRGKPRAKISYEGYEVSVSIEDDPKILAKSGRIPDNVMKRIKEGMDYIGRNKDIFLKHYMDTDDSFDDEDLFNALREKGEYK